DLALAIVAEVPRRRAVRDIEKEVAKDRRSRLRVRDLGMKLDAVALPLDVFECGDGCIRRRCGNAEAGRRAQDFVAVARPYALVRGRAGEERRVIRGDVDFGASVLALR